MSPIVENRGRPKDAAKRAAILQAARDLFMNNGFAGTSMDNLASVAGVSKATLYSHFADKYALYRAIIEDKVDDYQMEDFSNRLCGDMERDLALIAESMQNLIYDDDAINMLRMVITEARERSPIVALFEESGPKAVFQRIADYFAAQKRAGADWLGAADDEAELFTGLIMGHRRLIQVLMGVKSAPDAAKRRKAARQAVASFVKLRRD